MHADAGQVLNDACSDFEEPLSEAYKFGLAQRVGLRNCRAHCVHQPERSRVQYEADLIGRRAVAGCAVGGKLGLVQFYQTVCPSPQARRLTLDVASRVARNGPGRASYMEGEP